MGCVQGNQEVSGSQNANAPQQVNQRSAGGARTGN